MATPRDVLTPDALAMLQAIAAAGSFAAAARTLDVVPSALTYRVRQMEDALDVLLFDRSSRRAQLTAAGTELLREGTRLLTDIDAIANRVKRVATGWEPQLTIAVDGIVASTPVLELCDAFFALKPPTRLRLTSETLSGTLEALTSGEADLALGVVLAAMNYAFYQAIAALPLGTVAAIEFAGPIALAVAGARTRRNLAALALAAVGVHLLTGIRLAGAPLAFAWAFANAALFTLYIVLAHAVSRADAATTPVDRLGASMLVAAVAISPSGLSEALPALVDPVALGAGIAVGVSSSVIPYVFDQLAMARLPRATYALFVALLPATAVLVGILVLRQWPTQAEWLGVGLVACGVALHRPAGVETRECNHAIRQPGP
jgi:inner membrane transporter RhtA